MLISAINLVGNISTIIMIFGIIWGLILWSRGILSVLYRLGKGLATRKIAIFAEYSEMESLRHLLIDASIFKEKNIIGVSNNGDIGRAEKATLYLVHWPSWENDLEQTLSQKNDGTGLVVYAPRESGSIPNELMKSLNKKRNVTVTNFRGRLLNDVLVSMMTTSCGK